MVRAGRHGEWEQIDLSEGITTIGWVQLPDLSKIRSKDDLRALYRSAYPEESEASAENRLSQVWRFAHEIRVGNYIAMPLKTQSAVAIGRVKSDYKYRPGDGMVKHYREVEWLKTVPKSAFDKDLLYSLGSIMTVCQISRNNAEERILALATGSRPTMERRDEAAEAETEETDIEEAARAKIMSFVKARFTGHGLTRLVDAVLVAQGYQTEVSPPGPDRGVDILASAGPLGFDHPRIAVQVKSTEGPVSGPTLQQFQGAMGDHKAEFGLFVSWGGFGPEALRRAKTEHFRIRLWDADDLLDALFENYDKFDEDLRAELPLKRVWTLVVETER
jgi:restriction system protein